jgi:hypothetical protein
MVMTPVVVYGKSANEIIEIVNEMKEIGWRPGKDFDFSFDPGRWDPMIGEKPKTTLFTFYKEEYSTYFALRWIS